MSVAQSTMEDPEATEDIKGDSERNSLLYTPTPPPISKESVNLSANVKSDNEDQVSLLSSDQTSSQLVELVQNLGHTGTEYVSDYFSNF